MKFFLLNIYLIVSLSLTAQNNIDSNWVNHWNSKPSCIIEELNVNENPVLLLNGKCLNENDYGFLMAIQNITGLNIDTASFNVIIDTNKLIEIEDSLSKYFEKNLNNDSIEQGRYFRQYIPFYYDSTKYVFISFKRINLNEGENSNNINSENYYKDYYLYKIVYSKILVHKPLDYRTNSKEIFYILSNLDNSNLTIYF